MHILAFENTADSGFGGQERSLYEICEGLAEKGFEISLAYRFPGDLLPKYRMFAREIIRIPNYVLKPRHLPRIIWDLFRLSRMSRQAQWDILYTSQYFDTAFSGILSHLLRIPSVCHLRLPAPPYLSRQYRWGLMRCSRIIAISNDTKNGYVAQGIPESLISVVYNAIDTSVFRPSERATVGKIRTVLYLGRLCPEKGVRTLIDAFQRIAERREDVVLHLYGDERACDGTAGFIEEMKALAGSRLDKQIIFYAPVANVVSVLQAADVLVLPSEWNEPFGRVLIEAMSCGLPVVATEIGGIPEVLSPDFSHWLVKPRHAERMSDKIQEIVDWRDNEPDIGVFCREHVDRKFSRHRLIHEVAQIMLTLVHSSGSCDMKMKRNISTSDSYNSWHREIDAYTRPQTPEELQHWHLTAMRRLPNLNGLRVLEIGCGRGDFSIELARRYPEAVIAATDFSVAAVGIALGKKNDCANVNFYCENAENLSFQDASFDFVISCECLEHVAKPENMVKEIRRVLTAEGRFIITTPSYLNGMLISWLHSWLTGRPFNSGAGVQPNENFFIYWLVKRMLEKNGLNVTGMESSRFQWLLLPRVDPARLRTDEIEHPLLRKLFLPFGLHFLFEGKLK